MEFSTREQQKLIKRAVKVELIILVDYNTVNNTLKHLEHDIK